MGKKQRRQLPASGSGLSFQDELDDQDGDNDEQPQGRARKLRNPALTDAAAAPAAAVEEEDVTELTLSLRLLDEVDGAKTLQLTATRAETVDAILRRVDAAGGKAAASASGSREQHGLMLAIDHWIAPGAAALRDLLRRRWLEGEPMFEVGRDTFYVISNPAYASLKHQFPYKYWEDLPAAPVSKKYKGAWWQRVPQLNGRPGEAVRLPEWCVR